MADWFRCDLILPTSLGGKVTAPASNNGSACALVCIQAVNVSVRRAEGCGVCGVIQADSAEGSAYVRECILRGHFHVAREGDKTANTAQDLLAVHNRRLGRAI